MKGERLQLVIEEDGTDAPPTLPLATVIKRLISPDGGVFHWIRLDRAVTCRQAATGKDWDLSELVIWPESEGTSLESELPLHRPGMRVPVRIANVVARIKEGAEFLDPGKIVYLGVGWIGDIQGERPQAP